MATKSCLSCGVELPPRQPGPGRPQVFCTACRPGRAQAKSEEAASRARRTLRVSDDARPERKLERLAIALSHQDPSQALRTAGLEVTDETLIAQAREQYGRLCDAGDWGVLKPIVRAQILRGLSALDSAWDTMPATQLAGTIKSLVTIAEYLSQSDTAPSYSQITLQIVGPDAAA